MPGIVGFIRVRLTIQHGGNENGRHTDEKYGYEPTSEEDNFENGHNDTSALLTGREPIVSAFLERLLNPDSDASNLTMNHQTMRRPDAHPSVDKGYRSHPHPAIFSLRELAPA